MFLSEAFIRIRDVLQDVAGIRWTTAELLRWWSDGELDIVAHHHPEAWVQTTTMALELNKTRQTLPQNVLRLIDIPRNMGATGSTPSKPVRQVSREFLDSTVPAWHSETGSSGIAHFTYDPRDPRTFFVYPAQSAVVHVELVHAAAPVAVTSAAQAGTLGVLYDNALIEFVLYKAYSKDADAQGSAAAAQAHLALYQALVGGKSTADANAAPKGHR